MEDPQSHSGLYPLDQTAHTSLYALLSNKDRPGDVSAIQWSWIFD
jgi:hypothetical protein